MVMGGDLTARAAFKQNDVSRVVKGVQAAGLPVARVIYTDGGFEVIVGPPESEREVPMRNPLDRLHVAKA